MIKLGKNARKRAARRAFLNDSNAMSESMPYAFHVIEYRDGTRRHLRFVSLTSYKEYRERFYSTLPSDSTGELRLVSDMSDIPDTLGQSQRARVERKGIGLTWDKLSRPDINAPRKKRYSIDGFK